MRTDKRVVLGGITLGIETIDGDRRYTVRDKGGKLLGTATLPCADGRLKAALAILKFESIQERLIR